MSRKRSRNTEADEHEFDDDEQFDDLMHYILDHAKDDASVPSPPASTNEEDPSLDDILEYIRDDDVSVPPPAPAAENQSIFGSIMSFLKGSPSPTPSEQTAPSSPNTATRPLTSSCGNHPMQCRSSTWSDSIRQSLLQAGSPEKTASLAGPSSPKRLPLANLPQTEKELDKFLESYWNKASESSSEVKEKIRDLKGFYDKKLNHLRQNYKLDLSRLSADRNSKELLRAFNEAKEKKKAFDRDWYDLKRQVADTLARSISLPVSSKSKNKLPPKAIKILTDWYESHMDHPYPTAKEKKDLAEECEIPTKQVAIWFNNKRSRDNNTGNKKSKRSK